MPHTAPKLVLPVFMIREQSLVQFQVLKSHPTHGAFWLYTLTTAQHSVCRKQPLISLCPMAYCFGKFSPFAEALAIVTSSDW